MVKTVLNGKGLFIAKVRGKANAKNISLCEAVCEFCNISLEDTIQFKIIKVKKANKKSNKKK